MSDERAPRGLGPHRRSLPALRFALVVSLIALGAARAEPAPEAEAPVASGPNTAAPITPLATSADPDWHIPPAAADAPAPASSDYLALTAALEHYRAIETAGGWALVPPGEPLALGARDPRVVALRARLRASGDYDSEMGADPWFFDSAMDRALRRVQRRHLLAEDGILGERTLEAVNVPVQELIGRIEATLARWRWLPRDLGPRHVWVNLARAQLEVVENGASVLTMRVVVGHRDRPTPSLGGGIARVVFNPTWSVPMTIAVEDLLPRQQQDTGFLARNRIAVLSGAGAPVDASRVDWMRLGAGRFPYRLVQAAGDGNSLGRIKIAFDNPYDIYLHDTPAKGMFGLPVRALSSGCVRLEDAPALATWLLAQDREWSEADTTSRMQDRATHPVALARTVPIWLVYLTVWTEDGEPRFGRDLYGRDERLIALMQGAQASR